MLGLVVLLCSALPHFSENQRAPQRFPSKHFPLSPRANDDPDPQLPVFHVVPTPHNWMNDPNGLFYDPVHGYYHMMYQYKTPRYWGHSVSKDLVHWTQLPVALYTDEWYDAGGVFTGSATVLDDPNQTPFLSYSVSTNDMQAVAYPKNRSDPYLVDWIKPTFNPIISSISPNGTAPYGRDDTTAWKSARDSWLMGYGTSTGGGNGAVIVFESKDFIVWKQLHELYNSSSTGMWECPDFFPIPNANASGTAHVTHLVKASTKGRDYWVTGTYDEDNVYFTPNSTNHEMGDGGQIFDYGKYYASKSFYDPSKDRQIIFGWVLEERNVDDQGGPYGWASAQSIARTIELSSNGVRIRTPPVPEMLSLRVPSSHFSLPSFVLSSNGEMQLPSFSGAQIELVVVLDQQGGGECGVSVRTDLSSYAEKTLVGVEWGPHTAFVDTIHSTTDHNIPGGYRSNFPIFYENDQVSPVELRIFVDASVIEVYVNNGLSCLTRRVYPILPSAVGVTLYSTNQPCSFKSVDGWNLAL